MPPTLDPRVVVADSDGIQAASKALRKGRLVAFPSETVYGLGADATQDTAVARIYAAKGRPTFNPLIVHVPSIAEAKKYVEFDDRAVRIYEQFCPGALSLVLPRRAESTLSLLVSAGLDSVAIRIPSHPIAQALLQKSQVPIAGPSANLSGTVSPTAANHVLDGWPNPEKEGPDLILDGGACSIGVESTVLDLTTPTATLLRPGGVSLEELQAALGSVKRAGSDDVSPKSPGMLSRHYSPKTPVYLNELESRKEGVFLGFGDHSHKATETLSAAGNLTEAAANLFAMLRRLDQLNARSISIAPIPDTGLGLAINDRLKRAASD